MGVSIVERASVRKRLMSYGYVPHEEGLNCFVRDMIEIHTLPEVAKMLGVNPVSVRSRLKKLGIKNPNKPGGRNNPGGYYGKKGRRIDTDKGVRHK